jgi:hypothetical protein
MTDKRLAAAVLLLAAAACGKIPGAGGVDGGDGEPDAGLPRGTASLTLTSEGGGIVGVQIVFREPDGTEHVTETDADGRASADIVAGTDAWLTFLQTDNDPSVRIVGTIDDLAPGDDVHIGDPGKGTPQTARVALPGPLPGVSHYAVDIGECRGDRNGITTADPFISVGWGPMCQQDDGNLTALGLAYDLVGNPVAYAAAVNVDPAPQITLPGWSNDVVAVPTTVKNAPASAVSITLDVDIVHGGLHLPVVHRDGIPATASASTVDVRVPPIAEARRSRAVMGVTGGQFDSAVRLISQEGGVDTPIDLDWDLALPPILGAQYQADQHRIEYDLDTRPAPLGNLPDADGLITALYWVDGSDVTHTWFIFTSPTALTDGWDVSPPEVMVQYLPTADDDPQVLQVIAMSLSYLDGFRDFINQEILDFGEHFANLSFFGSISFYGNN